MGARSNRLVALSSAAILAVYTAGYLKTRSAAERLTVAAAERRIASPPAATVARSNPPGVEGASSVPAAPVSPASMSNARLPHGREASGLAPSTPSPAPAAESQPPSVDGERSLASASQPPTGTNSPTATTEEVQIVEPPAQTSEPAPAPAPPTRQGQYKDGTYLGWGYSRHGDIQASVVVEDGRIVSAEIAQCRTRYSCSWVEHLPQQILSRQAARVDFVSGATQSSYAFEDAVAEALSQAK